MGVTQWWPDVQALVRDGAARAHQRFREGARWIEKGSGDWASDADLEVEQMLRAGLKSIAPGTRIHGEESGLEEPQAGDSVYTWHVDPIDGSANFVRGIPHFATVISLTERRASGDEHILLGITVDPCRDESFVAIEGRPTQLNGAPVRVAPPQSALRSVLAVVTPKPDVPYMELFSAWLARQLPAFGGLRRSGAMALDLAWCACGRMDAFAGINLAPWDTRAGLIQVRNAGGAHCFSEIIRSFPNPMPLSFCLVANSESLLSKLSGDIYGS